MKSKIHILLLILLIFSGAWWYYHSDAEISTRETPEEAAKLELGAQLEGTWQSTQDEQAGKIFTENTVVDTYEGESMSQPASWELLIPSHTEDAAISNTLEEVEAYIVVEEGTERFEYAVLELNKDTLVLNYLARGNTLEYQRVGSE